MLFLFTNFTTIKKPIFFFCFVTIWSGKSKGEKDVDNLERKDNVLVQYVLCSLPGMSRQQEQMLENGFLL